jgi:peptidoglycan/LPS O-acetylase OafA/YrhL
MNPVQFTPLATPRNHGHFGYRAEIDGLRAIAVVPVILFHAGFSWFSGGYVGVDIFFVISGYLITSIILAEKRAGTFTLLGFYERRARRILPALFFVMLACLFPAWILMSPVLLKDFSQTLAAVPVFASNVLFWRLTSFYFDPSAEEKPLLHTWSLGVEEQYYLIFPLLIILCWSLGRRRIAWVVAASAAHP